MHLPADGNCLVVVEPVTFSPPLELPLITSPIDGTREL